VYSPPIRGPYAENSEGVQVIITTTVRSPFLHWVFREPLRNTVEAVGRGRSPRNIAQGYALFGGNPGGCDVVLFQGTQSTNVNGGSVFSNSSSTSNNCASGQQGGSGDVTVTGGAIEVAGTFVMKGGAGAVSPAPTEYASPQSLPEIPTPDCSGLPDWGDVTVNKSTTLQPGIYSRIAINGNPSVVVYMDPGMYCITGDQGFTGTGVGQVIGSEVMIYMQNGSFDIQGGFRVQFSAPTDLVDASGNQWAHMLIYAAPTNSYPMQIRGGSDSSYSGTIYASSSACALAGSGDTLTLSSQVICDSVKLSGSAALTVNYAQPDNYMMPAIVELIQ